MGFRSIINTGSETLKVELDLNITQCGTLFQHPQQGDELHPLYTPELCDAESSEVPLYKEGAATL